MESGPDTAAPKSDKCPPKSGSHFFCVGVATLTPFAPIR